MDEQVAIELVTNVICQMRKTEPAQVPPESDLADTLGLDSLDAAEILAALHRETGVEVGIESADDLRTVAGIARRLTVSATR